MTRGPSILVIMEINLALETWNLSAMVEEVYGQGAVRTVTFLDSTSAHPSRQVSKSVQTFPVSSNHYPTIPAGSVTGYFATASRAIFRRAGAGKGDYWFGAPASIGRAGISFEPHHVELKTSWKPRDIVDIPPVSMNRIFVDKIDSARFEMSVRTFSPLLAERRAVEFIMNQISTIGMGPTHTGHVTITKLERR